MHLICPLGGPFPHARTPELTSTKALRQVLDVKTKARQVDNSSTVMQELMEGTTVVHWLCRAVVHIHLTFIRAALVLIYGLGQLLNECPRHSLRDQFRVIGRVVGVTGIMLAWTLGSHLYPLAFPWTNLRTFNIVDPRSASLYAQRDIPRAALAGLFGWFPTSYVSNDVSALKCLGICWGQTLWMAAMHLHRKNSDPSQNLRALARQYDLGTPPEALLMQLIGDHTFVRPSGFERQLNFVVNMIKPLSLMSLYRGTKSYLKLCRRQEGYRTTWWKEITYANALAKAALRAHREEACLAHLVNLRVCETHRFYPDLRPLSWGGWVKSFWSRDYFAYEGIGEMRDGTYVMTSGSVGGGMRHAVLYVRSHQGQRGIFFDPNVGLELNHQGKDHWQRLLKIAQRCNHDVLTFSRFEKRGVCDLSSLDIRRRFAELWA